MVKYQVWEAVPKSEVPKEAKKIDTAWAMKKKSNGTKRGRVNARGFKQVDGEHYDSSSIAAPVASDAIIRIMLVLAILAGWTLHVMDVKGAFLHGDLMDGEQIYLTVPEGMEHHYGKDVLLKLKKAIYGLKQAG